MRSKQRGQAAVGLGVLALMFVLLMFAVIDLGLLLNSWVRLSSATREVARAATVGYTHDNVDGMVRSLVLPGVSPTVHAPFAQACCGDNGSNDLVVLRIDYYD